MKKILKYRNNSTQESAVFDKEIKKINEIFKGITDVVKVYNPDYTIAFFNEAGYKLYNKTLEDVKGKKCYEILSKGEKCSDCSFDKVMKTKQIVITERYIAELNKFMDVCYSPVLNEYGEVVFIVERLRDITEMKRELNKAAGFQKTALQEGFPIPEKIDMKSVYVPASNEFLDDTIVEEGNLKDDCTMIALEIK